MTEQRLTVDHLRLNYTGPFNANDLFNHTTAFLKERGFDLRIEKDFEQNTSTGKHIEFQIRPWKKITGEIHHWFKIRFLIYDYRKVDAVVDKKKFKVGSGRLVMYLDGYLEYDYWNKWEHVPFFHFLRTIYINFLYKIYTERFEQRLTYDAYHLYHSIEQFLNLYRHYKVVSAVPPHAATTQESRA